MLQQTNTNTVGGNNNHNPHARWDLGGFGGQGCGGQVDCGNNTSIFKLLFEGKLQDECLHKLTITKYSHWATQPKKIHNALSVLCTDKVYKHFDNIIHNNEELEEATHMPTYPDTTIWLIVMDVKINTVYSNAVLDVHSVHAIIKRLTMKTHVFNKNLQTKSRRV